MDQLLSVVNKLQEVLASVGGDINDLVDLPQIAVVGGQSVGKSSVLESFVGRDFLPRGTGIVTRRPLVLQLCNTYQPSRDPSSGIAGEPSSDGGNSAGSDTERSSADVGGLAGRRQSRDRRSFDSPYKHEEWGEFGHLKNKVFTDFDAIRDEIIAETNRNPGPQGVSAEPILLKISSPKVINLTLVDLPGLTKVPIQGQSDDTVEKIYKMVGSFIARKNCLILAVTAANTDIANSDSLQFAKEADPLGERTIGVITKCDSMDPDTDALDVLENRVVPLQYGYVGVVCRNQQQINKKTSIEESLKYERRFFRDHPAYRHIADRCGVPHLALMLSELLLKHIQKVIPPLKSRLQELMFDCEQRLDELGEPLTGTETRRATFLELCSEFARSFRETIDGRRFGQVRDLDVLRGGARISFIFHDWFGEALRAYDPLMHLSDRDIRIAIRNCSGPRANVLASDSVFEELVRGQIRQLRQPAIECVNRVHEELRNIVSTCDAGVQFHKLGKLRNAMLEVVNDLLTECVKPTVSMVENLINMELAYCNTNHPDFPQPSELRPSLAEDDDAHSIREIVLEKESRLSQPGYSIVDGVGARSATAPLSSAASAATSKRTSWESDAQWAPVLPNLGGPISSKNRLFRQRLRMPPLPEIVSLDGEPTAREEKNIKHIKSLMEAYFNIVRKNISDLVPKAIMHFMVDEAKSKIQQELTKRILKEDLLNELMDESPSVVAERHSLETKLRTFEQAAQIIGTLKCVL